jgi:hypothetical protein
MATHPDIPYHPFSSVTHLSSAIHFTYTPDIPPFTYTSPNVIPAVPADRFSRKSPPLPTTTPQRVRLNKPNLHAERGFKGPRPAATPIQRPQPTMPAALEPSPPPHVSPCMRPLWRTLPSEKGGSHDRITVLRGGVPASAWSRDAASVWRLVSGGLFVLSDRVAFFRQRTHEAVCNMGQQSRHVRVPAVVRSGATARAVLSCRGWRSTAGVSLYVDVRHCVKHSSLQWSVRSARDVLFSRC